MTDGGLQPTNENRYPLYVVSYGRWDKCRTATHHERAGNDYFIVVEPEQYDEYAAHHDEDKLLAVPDEYHERYETYDDLGRGKAQGPGPARNFAWDHAREHGYDWHWVMDDNISAMMVFTENNTPVAYGADIFRAMEDFVLQYQNVSMAGPRYESFIMKKSPSAPITTNTRVYSCNLIRNDTGYRWAGRYNEDTDLSLRMLKDGWCTVVFNLFLQKKRATQVIDGGNTENFYKHEGTYPKSRMLKQQHPDVTTLTKRWDRWHHRVDYSGFTNKLVPKPAAERPPLGDYNFRMVPRETVTDS
jgi:hypothetical protein